MIQFWLIVRQPEQRLQMMLFAHKRFLLYVRAQTKKTEFEEIWKSVSKCVLDQIADEDEDNN